LKGGERVKEGKAKPMLVKPVEEEEEVKPVEQSPSEVLRSVTITYPTDPKQKPTVTFTGTWKGRDVQVTVSYLLKGYKQYLREQRKES
jgi:hypothetical protein